MSIQLRKVIALQVFFCLGIIDVNKDGLSCFFYSKGLVDLASVNLMDI